MDREKFLRSIISPQIFLPRSEMHFSRKSRKTLAGRHSFFLSKSAKEFKNYINFWKLFLIEVFLWTRRIHYWQPHWKKMTNSRNFLFSVRRRKKKFKNFFQEKNLSNCSCKHVERSSGIPASIFSTKEWNFFAQCQEMIRKLDRISDIPNGKSSTECRKGLAQCANKTSQNLPMHTSKAVFTTLL